MTTPRGLAPLLVAIALTASLAGCGSSAKRAIGGDRELEATLTALQRAARTGNVDAACELIAPVAVAQTRKRAAPTALGRSHDACKHGFGPLGLKELSRSLEGQHLQQARRTGDYATAVLAGPQSKAGSVARFVRIAGRWRLVLTSS